MEIPEEICRKLLVFQKNEITEHPIDQRGVRESLSSDFLCDLYDLCGAKSMSSYF